jgi:hypothetical protein
MIKKLVLLENVFQAKEYLKNLSKFKNCTPISFNFNVENLLAKNNIQFKNQGDYETPSLYNGISTFSRKLTENISKKYDLTYREISLFSLFYYKIYTSIAYFKKHLTLLEEIIKKERPQEIIIFKIKTDQFLEKETLYYIAKSVFGGKITTFNYIFPLKKDIREKSYIKFISLLQKKYSKIRLNLTKKKDKKIFISGGKLYFKSITDSLIKNKKYKLFNFDSSLRKSYFSNNKYISFYEFGGEKNAYSLKFEEKIYDFMKFLENEKIGNELKFEKNLNILLKHIIKNNFKKIIPKIEESYQLFKKEKIDLLLLTEEDAPFSKIMVKFAKKFDIPSIVLLHGIPAGEIMFGTPEASYFLVFGEKIKAWFLKNQKRYKKSKTKVEVVGCPRYDLFKENLNFSKSKQILYAMEVAPPLERVADTHFSQKNQEDALKMIIQTLKKDFPKYHLIFKARPKWDLIGLPEKICKKENFHNFKVLETGNNTDLINSSDLVVINHTTMGLEALILGKPVISVSFKEFDFVNPYKNSSLMDISYNRMQFKNSVEKILKQKKDVKSKQKENLAKFVLLDKKSTKRAVNFINSILNVKLPSTRY